MYVAYRLCCKHVAGHEQLVIASLRLSIARLAVQTGASIITYCNLLALARRYRLNLLAVMLA